ncbi:MAG: OmpA family protein [Hyphomicrobiales bacterium]|nr:OmpA family protein [Hyphomicrobiales bacterium]MCP5000086.1 OmpA family protein [Hyphomicrobiales bacterium]
MSILKALAAMMVLAAGLAASGCTSSVNNDPNSGVTDDPAVGFAKFSNDSKEHFTMTVGRRVYFTRGSSDFDDVALETLNLQAAWLVKNPKWLIKLQGFADDPGSEEANIKLSAARAQKVMDYLASKGVNPQRMWAKGYGKERLVRNCSDITCKSQNRRVIVNLRTKFDGAAPQYKRKQS